MIRPATKEDHRRLLEIAHRSKNTRDFGHMMFSSDDMYEKGWIRCYEEKGTGELLGFTCVRHKVREPETSLYFIAVDRGREGAGIGQELLRDLMQQCPHRRIVLNVTKTNARAIDFYKQFGFKLEGSSLHGKGLRMALEW